MGATKSQLKKDLATALRAKDEAAKSNIRMMLGAFTVAEVAGATPRELSDAEELTILTKEMHQRRDAATTYAEAGRPELAEKETSEAEFIATYLPAPLTSEELDAMVANAFAALGEEPTMKHMGALVKAVNAQAAGRADGKDVAARVRARLQA